MLSRLLWNGPTALTVCAIELHDQRIIASTPKFRGEPVL